MRDFFNSLDFSYILNLLLMIVPAILCMTVHESAHAIAAYRLGDETARRSGRISLNPFRHIDWFGLAMLAFAGFGWAKPVMVDSRFFKNPKRGMAITALAGPVSNFAFAGICWLLLSYFARTGVLQGWNTAGAVVYNSYALGLICYLLMITMNMNIGLGLFNLIPIPPLDGSKVLFAFLPDRYYYKLMRYERYGIFVLFALILLWRNWDWVMSFFR